MNITAPTTVSIKGMTTSNTANNIKLDATTPATEQTGPLSVASPPLTFSVVSLSLSLVASGVISPSNPDFNLSQLGVQVSNTFHPGATACVGAYQVVSSITPSNYAGDLYLRRTVVGLKYYQDPGANVIASVSNQDDTSNPAIESETGGKLYDLDGPGALLDGVFPTENSARFRVNFDEYAVLGNSTSTTKVSSQDLLFFVRLSCNKNTSTSVVLDYTYTGDNQIGLGSTNLSDNLQ